MTDSCRRDIAACRSSRLSVHSLLAFSLLLISAGLIGGCGGAVGSVFVSGQVSQDGIGTAAEIQFEQLNADGNRVGRSVTAYADEQGDFSATIEPAAGVSKPLECRLIVRVSKVSSSGLPTAFDENASPAKATRLRRVIRDDEPLNLLLTR